MNCFNRFAAVAAVVAAAGCANITALGPGAASATRVFPQSRNEVWAAAAVALNDFPMDLVDQREGVLFTSWYDANDYIPEEDRPRSGDVSWVRPMERMRVEVRKVSNGTRVDVSIYRRDYREDDSLQRSYSESATAVSWGGTVSPRRAEKILQRIREQLEGPRYDEGPGETAPPAASNPSPQRPETANR